jgi:hypothetical protein
MSEFAKAVLAMTVARRTRRGARPLFIELL